MKKIIFLLLLPLIPTLSQSNELQEALKFFPLQVGNYWQYKITKSQYGGTKIENWIGFVEVMSDTSMSNGKKYYRMKDERKMGFAYASGFIRVDSSNGNIYSYSIPNEIKIDSLLAKKGDGVDRENCHIVSEDTTKLLFGMTYKTRYIRQNCITSYEETEWEYAEGIGEIKRVFVDKMYIINYKAEILYAKVDGREYGTKSNLQYNYELPRKIYLAQNYPNPFNSSTIIEYYLPNPSNVIIVLYDALGRKVDTIVNGEHAAGEYSILLNAERLSAGIYFYTIYTGVYSQSKKMIFLK